MRHETRQYDFVVAGGGMAGMAAAVSAARSGLRTALVHDRPVLGGECGKEVRIPLQGAEGGQNHRYFRETGFVEELRLENLYRNPHGNAELWDLLLLEKVGTQPNLDLYLNTPVTAVAGERQAPRDPRRILRHLTAVTLGAEREWTFEAPLFADCTPNGMVAFLAGAEFLAGREGSGQYGESLAPPQPESHRPAGSLLFALKDAGSPAPFVTPGRIPREDPRLRLSPETERPPFWWVEWSGEPDEDPDPEALRWELLQRVCAALAQLKNDPKHGHSVPDWIGALPAAREVRRFLGDHVLSQQDLLDQAEWEDAVAVGGASLDPEPRLGCWPGEPPGAPFHLPGLYSIPLRCLYSRELDNLLLAGGTISATHVAAGSTRAAVTGGQTGEAIGVAAFHCRLRSCAPRDLLENGGVYALQQDLLRQDHFIPGLANDDAADLARTARITESSSAEAALERQDGEVPLDRPRALMLPLAGKLEHISVRIRAAGETALRYSLHGPDPKGNFIPGARLSQSEVRVARSESTDWVDLPVPLEDAEPGFYWLVLEPAPGAVLGTTQEKRVGVLSYVRDAGWRPEPAPWRLAPRSRNVFSPWRRVEESYCFRTDTWIPAFYGGEQVANRFSRAARTPNIWISAQTDFTLPEWLEFTWDAPVDLGSIYLSFNTDLDRDLRNLWTEYPFRAIPECVRDYRLFARSNGDWRLLFEERGNYQRRRVHTFPAVRTDRLRLEVTATHGHPHAEIYEVRLYAPEA